jgi:predicted membrane protein
MKIIIGIILILAGLRMRSWGRSKALIHPLLRPMYQNRTNFWFAFSVIGIVLLATGVVLITIGVVGK